MLQPLISRTAMIRHHATIAAVSLAACASLWGKPSTRLAAEWLVPSTSTSKVIVLVDADTGTTRIATVSGGGDVGWLPGIPTGTPDVSDVTGGLSGASGEVLAIASRTSNRVVLLDIDTAAPYPRPVAGLAGVGPSGVTSLGSAGTRELLVASSENGSSPGRLESRVNPGTTAALLLESPNLNRAFRRLQPATTPGGSQAIAVFTETFGVNTRFGLIDRDGANHQLKFLGTFSGNVEVASQVASHSHPATPYLIGYRPGLTTVQLLSLSLPLDITSSITSLPVTFPFAVSAVMPITDGGDGPLNEGFLAIADDGSEVRHFRVNAAGTGIEATGQVFTPDPGSVLSGVAVLPGIGIMKLEAPAAGQASTTFSFHQWDGAAWVQTDAGTMPDVATATAAPATVLFYDANPAASNAARLLGVQSMPDWTSLSSYPDPFPASVVREAFASSAAGLTPVGSSTITPPSGSTHIITTQAEPGVSITTLGTIDALLAPDLQIDPPSGTYNQSFLATATFDANRHILRYRRDGADWKLFDTSVPVAWTTSLQFSLEAKSDGSRGPIVSRQYTLPVDDILGLDSDNDGVPDFVEIHLGLDPFSGADADGDGVSDLDEILAGTNPADPLDTPPARDPEDAFRIAPAGGLSVVATASDHLAREVANGEDLAARALDGSLIARAPVAGPFAPPLPDGGTRGALLQANTAPPFHELVAITTPLYFNNTVNSARSGREIIGHIPADPPPVFAPAITPTPGMSLADAANAWISAAISAAANHPKANARTSLHPADSAVSVLLEHLFHSALAAAPPGGTPPALDAFTFFPAREADVARTPASAGDRAHLRALGYDHRLALDIASAARPAMAATADAIYQHHANNSPTSPGIALPVDALRAMLRGGPAPAGYSGAVPPATLSAATTAYNDALADLANAFRPFETWLIEVTPGPSPAGVYQRVSDAADVILLTPAGERFRLEKGIGLTPGTRFSVSGFTDTPPLDGLPTIEITAAVLDFKPVASDNDQDGNLLDDEWEKFFFGATGQDPYSDPHGDGFTLLQYFLTGTDPRGGTTPPGSPAGLFPYDPLITATGDGGYTVDFSFPAEWQDHFTFLVERSLTLAPGSFAVLPGIPVSPLGGDRLRATIPAAHAPHGKAFFRITLGLAP